jgi:glyoxylate reductase
VLQRLEAACDADAYRGDGPGLTPEELRSRVKGKQGLLCVLNDRIDGDLMDAAPDLKVISTISVGYDNIDVPEAHARGLVVTHTPDVLTHAVAEFTWGLILSITRRLVEGDRLIRRGGWQRWGLDFMLGTELRGKQLGIVGAGRIGRAVAAMGAAFGMRAVFSAREGRPKDPLPEGPFMSFDELLVSSDVISIHVPLKPETRHLIDKRALARMKRSAYLVNTSRGPVLDEAAVAWALKERLIAGAALDVFEREPEVHPDLLPLDNVVLVPHLGSATIETRTGMADLAARNLLDVLAGRPPLTPVKAK